MRKLLYSVLLLLPLALSCVPEGAEQEKYSLSLFGGSVTQGEPILLSLTVTGDRSGSFRFRGEANVIDPLTGEETPIECGFYSGGEKIINNTVLTFEDNGHRDFLVKDALAPGTYRFRISLDRDKKTASASSVVVVRKGNSGDNPDEPINPDDPPSGHVAVTDFTLPDGLLSEGGVWVLGMAPGDVISYTPRVTPSDADDPSFAVRSSEPSVVKAVYSHPVISLEALAVGTAYVTITAEGGDGMNKTFTVKVEKQPDVPTGETVTDFALPDVDPDKGCLPVGVGDEYVFTPSVMPVSAAGTPFDVSSTDTKVANVTYINGNIIIKGVYPGRASIVITANGGNGITKTLPIIVYKDVNVTIDFLELEATEVQVKTKTFPCKLRFVSDSDIPFPEPIVWTVTLKSVVNCTGHGSTLLQKKEDVQFYGNRTVFYDITNAILIDSYNVWKSNHTISLTLGVVRDNPLDPDLWRVTFDEKYRTQTDTRIMEYIKEFLQ